MAAKASAETYAFVINLLYFSAFPIHCSTTFLVPLVGR
jgi:hypothetical protein